MRRVQLLGRHVTAATLFVVAVFAGATRAGAQDADLILHNGRFWTGDASNTTAQAVAIRNDRLIVVGTNAQAMARRGAATRVIDLGGRFGTPGFIDDHTHFGSAGALLLGANLLDVSTPAALVEKIREAQTRLPDGAWITGGDWGAYEQWAANSTGTAGGGRGAAAAPFSPRRAMIDSVTPNTPVLINRFDRSAYLANARALALAGLSCGTPVEGLECENGAATGRVSGRALQRVRAVIPPKSFEQRLREGRSALAHLAELGVTGIHDVTPREQFPVYHELKRRGELTVRVSARPTLDKYDELAAAGIPMGFGDEWLRIGGLKGFVDGIQGNSTARFYEPQLHSGSRGTWRDSTNTAATSGPGSGMNPPGNMERLLFGLDSAGYWAHVHAIGDEAIDSIIDIMEKVMRVNGAKERRWRIIHSQVLRDSTVAQRYARLGLIAEVQPYHAIDDMRWMEERIGARSRWAYAFNTLHRAGVPLLFGSDWPGTNASWYSADPMKIIYAATTRLTLDGKPEGGWFPQERLDLETSLKSYTVNNAWAAGEEQVKGKLAVGLLADVVVLSEDLFRIAPEKIKDVQAMMTIVGGRIVFARAPFRVTQ